MNQLIQLIISQIPSIVGAVRDAHAASNPSAPALTSEEIIAAMEEAFSSSLTRDEMLKAALKAEIDAQGPQ